MSVGKSNVANGLHSCQSRKGIMTIWPRSSEKARTALRSLWARVSWRMADNGRFGTRALPLDSQQFLLQNSRSGQPLALLPALEALTSCLAFEEDYPRAFLQASEVSHPPILPKKTTQGSDYSSSGGSRVLMMAFSNSAIPTAPRCIKGLPSIGMKRREGIERIPNRAASSFSSSTLTL